MMSRREYLIVNLKVFCGGGKDTVNRKNKKEWGGTDWVFIWNSKKFEKLLLIKAYTLKIAGWEGLL